MSSTNVTGPYNRNRYNRTARPTLCLSALALALLLAPIASAQSLETVIRLPDTLGPLNGPYHLACTDDSDFPRLYIGGVGGCAPGQSDDSGGVIVANAIKCERLARIPTGPVNALCYVAPHNKLYVASLGTNSVKVVDCGSNQVASTVHVASKVPVMQYNSRNDRLYCGGTSVSVIDCTADTMVCTIPVAATVFALDSARNKLYAGDTLTRPGEPLAVVDCAGDSVVTTIAGLGSAGALCYNPTAGKVYVTSGDTLYAIRADSDSIVARLRFLRLLPPLVCDPQRNRVYFAYGFDTQYLGSLDCSSDSALLKQPIFWTAYSLVCNVARDRLYHIGRGLVIVVNGTSGQTLTVVTTDGTTGSAWSPHLDRLYCPPCCESIPHFYQACLLSAVDGAGDSVAGIVPLTMFAGQITLDTVRNRLYFLYPSSIGCVGTVDCARNIVTGYRCAGEMPTAICHNPNNDRLYWSTEEDRSGRCAVTVYDCAAESVVKVIPIGGAIWTFKFHRTLNKLFVYGDGSPYCAVTIVDCKYDTILARIPLAADHMPRASFLVPEDNRYWYLGGYDVVVVDCVGDTIVAHVTDRLGSMDDAGVCRLERKIYTPYRQVIDMDDPAHVETIPGVGGSRFLYVPDQHELYSAWNYYYPSHSDIHVLDTRGDTVDAVFRGPCQVSGMCFDRTGRYIYCAGYEDTMVFVIDTHAESVVAVINVPITAAAWEPLAVNRRTNRIYEAEYWGTPDGWIPVIRDSMPIGLEELQSVRPTPRTCQTMLRHGTPLVTERSADLYDASGRVTMVLRPGQNDIGRLAPGVYFVREARVQAQAVRKVVVTR